MKSQLKQRAAQLKSKVKLYVIAITMLFSFQLFASEKQKEVNSEIKEATVFLNGAQIERKGYFEVQSGTTELVFSELSPFINPKSIQAKGKGNYTILDVRHRIHYPEPKIPEEKGLPPHIKRKIQLLEDSLLEVSFTLSEIKVDKQTLDMEKNILLSTDMVKGNGKTADSIPLLREGMLFFREKLNDINKKIYVLNKKEYFKSVQQTEMKARLTQLKQYKAHTAKPTSSNKPIQQVVVTISAKQYTKGSMEISYMVSNAGWSAHYDLRASNTSSPINLTYKAKVYQKTGEDWNNVKLKLSTHNPNKGNIKPSLPIWYLDYRQNRALYHKSNGSVQSNITESVIAAYSNSKKKERKLEETEYLFDAEVINEYTTVSQNISNVEFNISLPYNIEATGEAHLVEVQTSTLPSLFYHTVIPKVDKEAFVMAKVTDWENLNLLPATANIFFDGTYIGETYINPMQLADTLALSLGRDPSIIVERKKRKDENRPTVIGSNIIKTISYELIVKNNKSSSINLIVEDQIPVSKNDEIKVNAEEVGKADLNDGTGKLTWNL